VLFDNMKTVVLERNTYGRGVHRFHAGFLELLTSLRRRLARRRRFAPTQLPTHRVARVPRYSPVPECPPRVMTGGPMLKAEGRMELAVLRKRLRQARGILAAAMLAVWREDEG